MKGLIDVGTIDRTVVLHSKCQPENKCVCCELAKSHSIVHPARPVQKRSILLSKRVINKDFNEKDEEQQGFGPGCISTDLVGPYSETSHINKFVGSQTFLIMDSKYAVVYGYAKKSDSISNLSKFITEAKLLGLEIKSYHSDNAKELTGKEVQKILNEKGIKRSATSAYSPQENSYAERHNKTEIEGVVAMILRARYIPKKFWFECKKAFCHIYNRIPTTTSKGYMSPEQHMFGKIPNVEYLRIWGCKGFINIPLEKRSKNFLARAYVGYLVGYSEYQMNAYRMWLPHWDIVVTSRNVSFDENIPTGDVNFDVDEYWLEIRKARKIEEKRSRESVDDFVYLEGVVFYDDDESSHFRVTRVTEHTGRYIVAHVTRYNPSITEEEQDQREIPRPYHVLDVERMLTGFVNEADDVLASVCNQVEVVAKAGHLDYEIGRCETENMGMLDLQSPVIPGLAPEETRCPKRRRQHYEEDLIPRKELTTSAVTNCEVQDMSNRYGELVNSLNLPLSAQEPLSYAMALSDARVDLKEPNNYLEAINSMESDKWREAIAVEINNLKKRDVLHEVVKPHYQINMVDTKYVFKKKEKHGVVYKYKARLVARGFSQIETVNYNEIFASVARHNSLRIYLKVSVDRGHIRRSIDFEAAFLFSPLENEEIYLKTPDEWTVAPGNVLKLKKSLYGLKQSPRYWGIMISDFLLSIGFTRCNSEPCMFIRDEGKEMILIYVDDAIISCETEERIDEIVKLITKEFELGENGPLDWYIGSAIEDNGDNVFMHQKDYVEKMLSTYEYDLSKTNETPLKEKFAILRNPEDVLFHDFKIREKIGSLMFTAVSVRPDIAFAVSYIARFTTHPSAEVCRAVNHIFGYLAGTLELGINMVKESDSELIVYCDADYAGDVNDYKSTTGVLVYIGSTVVGWYSSKQTTVAQSSTDSEILSMNFAAKEIVWLRGLLEEMHCPQVLPTILRGDSQSAIKLSRNPVFHKRTKHVMIKFMYLVECLRESIIISQFVAGMKNWADILTKSQKKAFFLACRTALNMVRARAVIRETLSVQESS